MNRAPHLRVDWWRVILDLGRMPPGREHLVAPISMRAVGLLIDVPPPTIQGWKMGAQPKHPDGERLIDLWIRHTGLTRADLPMTSEYAWQ